jgi:NAD+ synthase
MNIDPEFVEKVLTRFIKDEWRRAGFRKAVLGLSGGLDSSVCAGLASRALGPRNVLGLILPMGRVFPEEVADARDVAATFGIRTKMIDISPQIEAYFAAHPTTNRVLKGNKMARERMSILYDHSAREKALVLGTSNKTELLIGYGTLHGDMASAFNPIGDLYKTQVRTLARRLGVPDRCLSKRPTAGLWPGQTDEDEIGLTYETIDRILYEIVDLRKSRTEAAASGLNPADIDRVVSMMKKSEFKRKLPPIAKISFRTIGHDFLYAHDRED